MSKFLGQFAVSLHEDDIHRLLATFAPELGVAFQSGCLSIRTKGPMGMGITLVAIPRSTPEGVVFSIPFDQIRGDKTGGMASMLAGGLWGLIRPAIEKRIQKELGQRGIPAQTVSLSQTTEGKVKVGQVLLHLQPLNAWLLQQPPRQGCNFTLDSLWASEQHLSLVVGVYHQALTGLPAAPGYG